MEQILYDKYTAQLLEVAKAAGLDIATSLLAEGASLYADILRDAGEDHTIANSVLRRIQEDFPSQLGGQNK